MFESTKFQLKLTSFSTKFQLKLTSLIFLSKICPKREFLVEKREKNTLGRAFMVVTYYIEHFCTGAGRRTSFLMSLLILVTVTKNEKVIGLIKDELGEKIIPEIATLRPRTCCYLKDDND